MKPKEPIEIDHSGKTGPSSSAKAKRRTPHKYKTEMRDTEDFDFPEVREPIAAYGKKRLTVEEYLAWEEDQAQKHEYYQGEVFAMSGSKLPHNIISVNFLVALAQRLKGKPCRPYNSDQRIHIPQNTLFTYPDISVVCGDPVTLNGDNWNILNPSLLVEMLSPSTRKYDRGEKFSLYQDIPTLQEYLLVDTQQVRVDAFRLSEERHWEVTEYKDADSSLYLPTLGLYIPMSEIYDGVRLPRRA